MREQGRSAAYAAGVRHESGGIITKLAVGLFLIAVAAGVAMFLFVRQDEPLALSPEATVDVNRALRDVDTAEGEVALVPGGEIYVATFVRNEGRFPVTLEGLGELGEVDDVPYIPTELHLGDGTEADPSAAAEFVPQTLDPGEGVGVLVVYWPNPDFLCQLLPDEAAGRGTPIEGFPVTGSVYGVSFDQELTASDPFTTVAPATRAECEAAFADAS